MRKNPNAKFMFILYNVYETNVKFSLNNGQTTNLMLSNKAFLTQLVYELIFLTFGLT